MLGRHIHRDAPAVAGSRVDQALVYALFPHDLLRFDAVLLRILFKIQIVQQAGIRPEVGFFLITKLPGHPAHHALHRHRVAQMERFLIVFGEQGPSFFPCHCLRSSLFFIWYQHTATDRNLSTA